MSRIATITAIITLVFSSTLAANGAHLVVTHDTKGDTAACVDINVKYNKLALKLVPDNHPTVRIIHASYAGPDSGVLWLVVEFDDLADMARATEILDANKQAVALQEEINKQCPVVSTSIGTQLYHHKGTN